MSPNPARCALQVVLLVSLACSAAAAQEPTPDSWRWRVAPYLWAPDIDGTLTTSTLEVDFDADFSQIWDNLDGAALVVVEASKGRLTLLGDVIYMGLDSDGETPTGADAEAEVDMTVLELAGLYRLTPSSPFELGLGVRYADVESDLQAGVVSGDSSRDTFDGFAAGRATWPFAQRWSVAVYGDVGAGDSDLTWQASAMLGLHLHNWGLGFGYRVLDYDFEQSSDALDLAFEGLLFGIEFRF